MSRLDTVRNRTAKVKKQVAPRASDAREAAAAGYADKISPKVEAARHAVGPRVEHARDAAVPRLVHAKDSAKDAVGPHLGTARDSLAPHLESARGHLRDDIVPKMTGAAVAALAASEPVRDEARSRGIATLAALRGELTPADVRKAHRRARRGSRLRKLALLAGIAGAGVAAWRWWVKQSEPDWTVDEFRDTATPGDSGAWSPTAATEAGGKGTQVSTDNAAASPDEALADAAESERLEETSADAWRPAR